LFYFSSFRFISLPLIFALNYGPSMVKYSELSI
jgi:hypothetical protein